METQVPEVLDELNTDQLTDLEAALVAEFDAAFDNDGSMELLGELAEAIDRIRNAKGEREAEAAEEAQKRADLRDRVKPTAEQDDDDAEATADDAADDENVEDADADASTTDDGEEAVEKEPELVAASASNKRPPSARKVAGRQAAPTAPPANSDGAIAITAAADVPGFSSGATIDKSDLAVAMHSRARGLADKSPRLSVATVKTATPDELTIRKDSDALEIITAAVEGVMPKGTDAGALVAAGGWCTPSETLFDQFAVEGRDGLLDLPTVGISRGGLSIPSYFGIGDALGALWTWSEANDESAGSLLDITDIDVASNVATATATAHGLASGQTVEIVNASVPALNGTYTVTVTGDDTFTFPTDADDLTDATADGQLVKGCLRIPCPAWTDYRLGAEGICLTHGNLMDRSYPEQTRRFIDLTMTAHMHRLSNAKLAKIVATATAVTVTSAPSDIVGDLLSAIDLQVADYRSQYLMSVDVVLDAVFPLWVVEAIRSSLAMRAGVDATNVTDQQIVAHFTNRNVRPQFLHGYDPLFDTSAATAWPSTSKFLLYPAGSYVEGDGGSIDLGVVRDSTLNKTNDFTAAWSEQFYLVMQRGPAAREVTVTTDVDGQTGGPEFLGA